MKRSMFQVYQSGREHAALAADANLRCYPLVRPIDSRTMHDIFKEGANATIPLDF